MVPAGPRPPTGVWATVSPRYGVWPDWQRSLAPRKWPAGLPLLFVLGLVGAIVAFRISSILAAPVGYENTLENTLDEYSLAGQFVLVALLAPLIEEVVYRLPLTASLRLGTLGAAGVLGALSLVGAGPGSAVLAAAFAVIAAGACVLWAQSLFSARSGADATTQETPKTWRAVVERWWARNPRWPVWIAIAAFGLVHLNNFDVQWSLWAVIAAPLVVSPQLWLGLMFTTARVRYGWWAGLTLHIVHNLAIWGTDAALGGAVLA